MKEDTGNKRKEPKKLNSQENKKKPVTKEHDTTFQSMQSLGNISVNWTA